VFDKTGNLPLRSRRDYAKEDQTNKPQDYTQEELMEKAKETTGVVPAGWRLPQGDIMASNDYLNTPPTKLNRDIKKTKNKHEKAEMEEALDAWRTVVPGPFIKSSEANVRQAYELVALAKSIIANEHNFNVGV